MRRLWVFILISTGICLFSRGPAQAAAYSPILYINNSPFHGEVFIGNDKKLYVELAPLVQALKMKAAVNPSISQMVKNGNIFVSLRDISKALQMNYIYNPITKIADLMVIHRSISEPSIAAEPAKKVSIVKEGMPPKSPIAIVLQSADTDYRTGGYQGYYPAMRVYTRVQNISDSQLQAATFRCDFLDVYGKPFSKDTEAVSNLAPQESKDLVFFWNNSATPSAIVWKVYLLDWTMAGGAEVENSDKDKPILKNGSY